MIACIGPEKVGPSFRRLETRISEAETRALDPADDESIVFHVCADGFSSVLLRNFIGQQMATSDREQLSLEIHAENAGVSVVVRSRERATAQWRVDMDISIRDQLGPRAHLGKDDQIATARIDDLAAADRSSYRKTGNETLGQLGLRRRTLGRSLSARSH